MSSLFAHAAAGAAVYFAWSRPRNPPGHWPLWPLMFIAVAPDLDHLAHWFLGANAGFRPTHSLAACAMLAIVAWVLCRPWHMRHGGALPLKACLAAAGSHLLLDSLTGLHGDPLLWPVWDRLFNGYLALLPAAGSMRLTNFYFWRNMALEVGILFPALGAWVLWQTGTLRQRLRQAPVICGALAMVFAASLWMGSQLQR